MILIAGIGPAALGPAAAAGVQISIHLFIGIILILSIKIIQLIELYFNWFYISINGGAVIIVKKNYIK